MSRIHTHYDNLKVARNAPLEVIKAAYRALAQRYHPDVNPAPDAARVMKVLNEAWAVLSDPAAKRRHDEWIEEQLIAEAIAEALADTDQQFRTSSHTATGSGKSPGGNDSSVSPTPANPLTHLNAWLGTPKGTKFAFGSIAGAAVLTWIWLTGPASTSRQPSSPAPISQQSADRAPAPSYRELPATVQLDPPALPEKPVGVRWSPSGKPWPKAAGYLDGMQRRASGGLSKLTVDNTNGGTDVHIKLCTFAMERCTGLRNVFIPLGSSFTMTNLAAGTYDLRYRDLSSGRIAKSEEIRLNQIEEGDRTRFSVFRITLYRVQGGNTNFTTVPEEQF